jgi:hypothetical protein
MDCREEFEKCVTSLGYSVERYNSLPFPYIDDYLEGKFEIWQACWNLRQESKPLTVDEKIVWEAVGRLYENGTNDLKDCDIVSQAIHAALPSQPDIEQLKTEIETLKEQKAKVYGWLDTSNFKVNKYSAEKKQMRETIEEFKKLILEGQQTHTKQLAELARKNDQIKRLENGLRLAGGMMQFDNKYVDDLLAEIGED